MRMCVQARYWYGPFLFRIQKVEILSQAVCLCVDLERDLQDNPI